MKKYIIFIFLLIIISFSCKEGKLFTFYITDQTNITIENNLLPIDLPFDIPTPDITTNSETEFENNDTRTDLVKEIVIKELGLTITSPADETFSFLKSIHLYISTDETDEIELAWNENIVSDAKSIQLDVTTEILDKYVKSSIYKIRTEAVTKETLFHDVDIQIDLQYRVTANIF